MNEPEASNLTEEELIDQDGVPIGDDEMEVHLKEGIDLNDLKSGQGTTFEVDLGDEANAKKFKNYFNPEEVYKGEEGVPGWEDDDEEDEDEERTQFEKMALKMADITDGMGGVLKKLMKEGVGDVVPEGAFVKVHYNAYLEYADEPFDSTRLSNQIKSFRLDHGEVTEGVDIAVSSMRKKERSRFIIQPRFYMGEHGCPPRIPANATVLFDIELVDFSDRQCAEAYYSLTMEERALAPLDQVIKAAETERHEGKKFYKDKKYYTALRKFEKAIRILDSKRLADEKEEAEWRKKIIVYYLNAALAAKCINNPTKCINYSQEVIRLEETNAKAHYLSGKAYIMKGHYGKAERHLKDAQRNKPDDPDINAALTELHKREERYRTAEKSMCQKMFGFTAADQQRAAQAAKESNNTETAEDSYTATVKQLLRDFKSDPEQLEMPWPIRDLTEAEVQQLHTVGDQLDLDVVKQRDDPNSYFVFRKRIQAPAS